MLFGCQRRSLGDGDSQLGQKQMTNPLLVLLVNVTEFPAVLPDQLMDDHAELPLSSRVLLQWPVWPSYALQYLKVHAQWEGGAMQMTRGLPNRLMDEELNKVN